MLRDELNVDSSAIWNLSGRWHIQIVELIVVTAGDPALVNAFVGSIYGLRISISYNPRRSDKFESEAVALENFKTRADREIKRINNAASTLCSVHNQMLF